MDHLLWYVGQSGIVLEVIGAVFGVRYAWQTKELWAGLSRQVTGTYDSIGRDLERPREEFVGQYAKQVVVFSLLAAGLALQFVGNFAPR